MNRPKPKPKAISAPVDVEYEEAKLPVAKPAKGLTQASRSLTVEIQKTQFQARLEWAMYNPRSIHRSMENMVMMATKNEKVADAMTYTVPRGGDMIDGQTIKFAEVVAQCWPHSKSDAYVALINREDKYVVARGTFYDFETDNSIEVEVSRSIRDKHGNLYSPDMITTTCNAACSIARRNAILRGVPSIVWMDAWEASRVKAAGKLEGLAKKRQDVLQHFMRAGIAPDRLLKTIGVRNENQLTEKHITSLRGMWTAYNEGEETLEDLFPPVKEAVPVEQQKDETEAPAKKQRPKTLDDLADEVSDKAHDTIQEALDEREQARADEERVLQAARDAGRQAFHKGIQRLPERYRKDEQLGLAWTEGFKEAEEQYQEEMVEGDNEDTTGVE